jgi:nucleoside-diphosphate-sugar epimerase
MTNKLAADLDYILENTADLWNELQYQSIFMTGGTGFIGAWFLETFAWANAKLKANIKLTVLSRNVDAFAKKAPHLTSNPDFTFITGDVRNFNFPDGIYPLVIHAAADADAKLNQEAPQVMLDTIVQGTERVLQFANEAGARNLLLVSSGAVYGKQPETVSHVSETHTGTPDHMQPDSAYAFGKLVSEHLCGLHAARHPLEIKIARCFAFVGPYLPLHKHFAIGNFIRDGLEKKDIEIKGDGSPYRSYQYAADLIIWLLHILIKGKSCVAYNVGSDQAISISELAQLVAKHFDPAPAVNIHKQRKETPDERYIPSVSLAKTQFGLSDGVSLSEAIIKTINWHKLPF